MKKNLLILAVLFTCQLHPADYYWVGGSGNWSNLNHWRLGSSGGSIPSIVPSSGDNVFFDANSGFTAVSKTVTLDANGFCNNITWGNVANSPLFITANSAFKVQVSGSLSLSSTTTYNILFAFKGAAPATLATNGTVLGQFGVEIDKPGSSLTVTDSLIVPSAAVNNGTNFVLLTSGTFNIAGKKVRIYGFSSDNNNVRTLEMTNTDFAANSGSNSAYHYTGANKTLNATGSTLLAFGYWADGGTYNKVNVTSGNGPNTILVERSTFSSLTFSPGVGIIFSHIRSDNTIDTLIFNGMGAIGYNYGIGNIVTANNNTIGTVKYALEAQINGTGNVIGKIECLRNFLVNAGSNNNTVDSLILASNRSSRFSGAFNINKYLYVAGAPCDAYTEIFGDSTAGTVNFAAGAMIDISNVILTGVKATGPGTPFPVNGIDGGGNAGFTITEPSGTGTTLYWVGGAGDWNEKSHWSLTSGGTGGACVPFKYDNVVFDANSGLATRTVTTSSSSFCKDITWASGVGTTTFNESPTYSLRVYGSAVLQSSVTMNANLEFYGTDAVSLTTNGGGTGSFSFYVVKTGSGSLTILDNWINPSGGGISFFSGNLNMAGRTVSLNIFASNVSTTRTLNISNATITVSRWIYQGLNKNIVSAGSHITSLSHFQSNQPGSNYPWVDLIYGGTDANVFSITGTTFGQLTFTSTSTTSAARILYGNTIRRLEFKGAGFAGNNPGSNNIDSLILAGSRNYTFSGTNTIIKYFKAEATPCAGLTEMRGYNGTVATLGFQSLATEVHINNVYMQNMTAAGPLTPLAFNGADAGGNTGWTINSAVGAARYWVGGAGDWNEPIHWSATSGGAGGACVPTVYDDVYFNAGSGFTAVSKTVTVNNGNAYARNINWTGATNAPIWNKAVDWNIEIWGDSIILNPAATFNASVLAKGANASFLKGTVLGNFDVYIDKPGGSLTLLNNYSNTATDIGLMNGAFNAPGRTLNISVIDNTFDANRYLNNVFAIDISNSNITAAAWRFAGTIANHTLNATNATINAGIFNANGLQYDTVNISGNLAVHAIMNSATINRLTFTNPSTTSLVGIGGSSNNLGMVEFKGSGGIYGDANVMDTLIFFPGNTYTLNAGSNTIINDAWYGSGTPCRATEIVSSNTTTNATITKNTGNVNFDYVRLRRITAAGAASPFVARSHSTNLGNNVNWNIASYDGAAPIYGLGPNIAVLPADFPIVLRTDGFFGSPSSQYTWNDNSTADTLLVTGPGTYNVDVSFPDGCSINDAITVFDASTLPVTLVNFTAKAIDCESLVQWKVDDAVNFSHFVIEQSKDGRQFVDIGQLLYEPGMNEYSYYDKTQGNGTVFYRLRLVDIDGNYKYSSIASVNRNCNAKSIQVYPTVTSQFVTVALPPGYEKARLQVVNITGQHMIAPVHSSGMLKKINLQGLSAGTYLLQVLTDNKQTNSFWIIKQ